MSRRHDFDDATLSNALRTLADHEAQALPGPHLEARVMESWDRVHAQSRHRLVLSLLAAAATIVLTALATTHWAWPGEPAAPVPGRPLHVAGPDAATAVPSAVAPSMWDGAEAALGTESHPPRRPLRRTDAAPVTFVVVGEPLIAGEPVQVVRMRVAADRLAAFGLRPVSGADSVDVELLVGEDGVARGLRLNREME